MKKNVSQNLNISYKNTASDNILASYDTGQ